MLRIKKYSWCLILLFGIIQLIPKPLFAEDLVWTTSQQEAFDLARQQGKKVLLLAGRAT